MIEINITGSGFIFVYIKIFINYRAIIDYVLMQENSFDTIKIILKVNSYLIAQFEISSF